ncbi:MAG: phosphoglycerate kinase, partial [Candidatus Bathyarchaeia archaeon]
IKELSEKGAKVVILAHQGRPGDPDFIPLEQHAQILGKILGKPVKYVNDVFGEKAKKAIRELKSGEILVLDNVRNFPREAKDAPPEEHAKSELVVNLAPLADLFVNDAFAAAHRSHASIVGFTVVLPSAAGRIMEKELKALSKVMENPEKPCIYILGGAKADDSLRISKYVLDNNIADYVLTAGITGHLFLVAKGYDLGKPNMEILEKNKLLDLVPGIRELINRYPERIETPIDLAIEVDGKRREISLKELPVNYPIYDIGENTIKRYTEIIMRAKSIVFSGPPGVFEREEFKKGTKALFEAIASSRAFSLVGGGHSVAAVQSLGLADKMGYVSTAGGALIEFLMGRKLPGVVALEEAAKGRR